MMEIESSDDDTLRTLASGASLDYSSWPLLLSTIVSRIERIAHNDFPIPIIPPPARYLSPPQPRFLALLPSSDSVGPSEDPSSSSTTALRKASDDKDNSNNSGSSEASSSQETNKENTNPAPFVPAPNTTPTATQESGGGGTTNLPVQIQSQLTEITSTLTNGFPSYPPHTIQRLAELVLRPRQHYRSLPSYLHAVDRVVHVTSGANVFPLPPAIPDASAMTALANGIFHSSRPSSSSSSSAAQVRLPADWPASASASAINPGSDEALGGALLTPIPWLVRRASSVDGADAALSPPEDGDAMDGDGDDAAAAQQQPQSQAQQHHSGSGRPRNQQRLSIESTETIEGPNGMGHIETVSVSVNGIISHGASAAMAAALARGGSLSSSSSPSSSSAGPSSSISSTQQGITQGELLREEQRAGVVPVSQLQRNTPTGTSSSAAASSLGERGAADDGDDYMAVDTHSIGSDGEPRLNGGGGGGGGASSEDGEAGVAAAEAQVNAEAQAAAEAQPHHAQGSGTNIPSAEEGDEETTIPHARGPQAIGLADTGPQAAGTSFPASATPAVHVEMGDIDIEGAVGRPADEAAVTTTTTTTVVEGGAAASPTSPRAQRASTPKRAADEALDATAVDNEPPAKRAREEGSGGGSAGASLSDAAAAGPHGGGGGDNAPPVDSDGDVLIGDDAAIPARPLAKDAKAEERKGEGGEEEEEAGGRTEAAEAGV